jgi:8-oxo-dGTP diphosphatase
MEYKNPCATADIILERDKQILLIRRKHKPFRDMWALPGGHLNYGKETLEETAVRELREETGVLVDKKDLEFFGVYSEPKRDPRGHYITHVYVAKNHNGKLKADDDAKEVRFFSLENLPELAFDHQRILNDYFKRRNL